MRMQRFGMAAVLALAACGGATAQGDPTTSRPVAPATAAASGETVEFKRAQLRVEINATEGDAGLQVDLDHEPWSSISLTAPDGTRLFDLTNHGVLEGYGLTEFFSESSEPPFTEFPLDEFKQLFPEGVYVFQGETTDGVRMQSAFTLTHGFPAAPEIITPAEGSAVASDALVVAWTPGSEPEGVEVVRYQILVINEDDSTFQFSAFVPAAVTSISVPGEFLTHAGLYKVEVLAIEANGNQTLSELEFTVG